MSTTTTETPAGWVAPEVTEGSIFVSSWGYDQTNVDFYRVVRRTKATVWVQRVQAATVSGRGAPQENVVATAEPVVGAWVRSPEGYTVYDHSAPAPVEKHRLVVNTYSGPAFTVNSYSSAHLWDGQPEYRTGAGWGH